MLMFVSLAFWSWCYFRCQQQYPNKSPEWWARTVTLFHGSVATLLGAWLCGQPSMERCNMPIGVFHHALMIWCWGYFTFDLMWCLYYWPSNWLMLCHHGCAVGGVMLYMGKHNSGCTLPCTMTFMEITNPLLQIRWLLRYEGYDKNIFYYAVEVIYLVLFMTLRGFVGTYVLFRVMMDTTTFKTDDKIITLVLYIVSIAFIYEIIGFVLYKYKHKLEEFEGFIVEMGEALNDHL